MAFDGFVISNIVSELNKQIIAEESIRSISQKPTRSHL